jgi:PleD family two-component response regulator
MLKQLGFTDVTSISPSSALKECIKKKPYTILLNLQDVARSGKDPYEFIAEIRKLQGKEHIFILVYLRSGIPLSQSTDTLYLGIHPFTRLEYLQSRLETKGFL